MLFALSVLPDNAAASLVDQLAPATKPNKCCLTVNCEDSFSLMPIEPDPIAICAQPFDSPCVCVAAASASTSVKIRKPAFDLGPRTTKDRSRACRVHRTVDKTYWKRAHRLKTIIHFYLYVLKVYHWASSVQSRSALDPGTPTPLRRVSLLSNIIFTFFFDNCR